jgi:hypothetical protein
MFPCNVLAQEHGSGEVEVSAINPMQSIDIVGSPELNSLAEDVTKKLKALERITNMAMKKFEQTGFVLYRI